jgi:hypothetical protein
MARPQKPNEERDRYYNEQATPIFSCATFSCFLNRSSIRFLQDGQLSVSLIIPPEQVDNALSLRYLAANPLPLVVSVEVSSDYLDDLEESEARLRAL